MLSTLLYSIYLPYSLFRAPCTTHNLYRFTVACREIVLQLNTLRRNEHLFDAFYVDALLPEYTPLAQIVIETEVTEAHTTQLQIYDKVCKLIDKYYSMNECWKDW